MNKHWASWLTGILLYKPVHSYLLATSAFIRVKKNPKMCRDPAVVSRIMLSIFSRGVCAAVCQLSQLQQGANQNRVLGSVCQAGGPAPAREDRKWIAPKCFIFSREKKLVGYENEGTCLGKKTYHERKKEKQMKFSQSIVQGAKRTRGSKRL